MTDFTPGDKEWDQHVLLTFLIVEGMFHHLCDVSTLYFSLLHLEKNIQNLKKNQVGYDIDKFLITSFCKYCFQQTPSI